MSCGILMQKCYLDIFYTVQEIGLDVGVIMLEKQSFHV